VIGFEIVLVGLSALAQFLAAFAAIRLGRRTRQPAPWDLIAVAVFLMGVRRSVSLYRGLVDPTIAIDPVAEGIAFLISLLILAGLWGIAPYLVSARASTDRATALGRILDQSRNEIYLFDGETLRFTEVSRGACENLGYTMEELSTLTPLDVKPEFTAEGFAALLEPLRSGESEQVRFYTVHRRKDGSHYPVEANLQLGRIGDRPTFYAVIVDVSARRQEEAARRRLEVATEQAGEGIVILDRTGTVEYANPAFANMLQLPRESILGEGIDALAFGTGDERLLAEMRSKLLAGAPWSGRYESVWPDGSRHNRDATVTPIRGPENTLQGFIGVIRDATRETALEQELRQSQKMEAVGQLAGGVAHDFNNLLTVIGGWASALLDDEPETVREAAREIGRATDRASALTRQLLTFSRRDQPRPRAIDLNEQLAETQKLLARLIGDDVLLDVRLGADVGSVHADPGQIEQVMMNLAINARDAMPQGGALTVTTRAVVLDDGPDPRPGDLPPGRYAVLRVADTGEGMDPAVRDRAFEPFFTTKTVGKGTGLGLSTAYAIVSSAGGTLTVESAPGRGTRFDVFLPRVETPASAGEERSRARPATAPAASVLLVEDEPAVRDLARRFLEAAGHRVRVAVDGREALAAIEASPEPIDLLLTDMVMPHVSGAELARRLRERFPDLRVVMTSGYPDRDGSGAAARPDVFVTKPFRREELMRAVSEALARPTGRDESGETA